MVVTTVTSQVIFGFIMLMCILLILLAMMTGSWSQTNKLVQDNVNEVFHHGLMPWTCVGHRHGQSCKDWWKKRGEFHITSSGLHATTVLMCAAVGAAVLSFAWNLLTLVFNCCQRQVMQPLVFLSGLTTILLLLATIVYGINHEDVFKQRNANSISKLSWSYYVAVLSTIFSAVDTIVAVLSHFMSEQN